MIENQELPVVSLQGLWAAALLVALLPMGKGRWRADDPMIRIKAGDMLAPILPAWHSIRGGFPSWKWRASPRSSSAGSRSLVSSIPSGDGGRVQRHKLHSGKTLLPERVGCPVEARICYTASPRRHR